MTTENEKCGARAEEALASDAFDGQAATYDERHARRPREGPLPPCGRERWFAR